MVVLDSKRRGKDVASWKVAEYDFRTCQYGSLCHSVPMTIGSGPERPEYYIILCLAQTGEAEGKQCFWVFQAGTAERCEVPRQPRSVWAGGPLRLARLIRKDLIGRRAVAFKIRRFLLAEERKEALLGRVWLYPSELPYVAMG